MKLFGFRFCFRTEIVAVNNTQFLMERRNADKLFCIVTDNLKDGFRYRDREPIENLTDFAELTARHKSYVRPDDRKFEFRIPSNKTDADVERKNDDDDDVDSKTSIEFDESSDFAFDEKSYLIGRPIWTYRRDLKAPGLFSLPSGRDCNSISPIRYGMESEISCARDPVVNCSNLPFISASEFFDFSVVRSPGHFRNKTDRFVEISVRVCSAGTCANLTENGHGPIHESTPGCDNVVTSARYVVVHDGVKGVKSVNVKIEIANFSTNVLSEEKLFLTQVRSFLRSLTLEASSRRTLLRH